MNTFSSETLEGTGDCYSAASEPKLLHSRGQEEEIGRHAARTGYFQRGIVAHGFSQVVASNTDVGSLVWFAPSSMDDA